jgi:hypothetical protein
MQGRILAYKNLKYFLHTKEKLYIETYMYKSMARKKKITLEKYSNVQSTKGQNISTSKKEIRNDGTCS